MFYDLTTKTQRDKAENETRELTAVFGASGFDQLAGWTGDSGVKHPPVIWINLQLASNSLFCHRACRRKGGEEKVEGKYHHVLT